MVIREKGPPDAVKKNIWIKHYWSVINHFSNCPFKIDSMKIWQQLHQLVSISNRKNFTLKAIISVFNFLVVTWKGRDGHHSRTSSEKNAAFDLNDAAFYVNLKRLHFSNAWRQHTCSELRHFLGLDLDILEHGSQNIHG